MARELAPPIECGTNLADLLSSALPPDKKCVENNTGLLNCGRATSPPPAILPHSNGSGEPDPAAGAHNDERNAWPIVHDVVGNALDDLHLDDLQLGPIENDLLGSAPINIPTPRAPLAAFTPPPESTFLRYGTHSGMHHWVF